MKRTTLSLLHFSVFHFKGFAESFFQFCSGVRVFRLSGCLVLNGLVAAGALLGSFTETFSGQISVKARISHAFARNLRKFVPPPALVT